MFYFSKRSLEKFNGVNPKLVDLMKEAIKNSPYDFMITEGVRDMKRQTELLKQGKSQTMKSYHLTGQAVDIAIIERGNITWEFPLYVKVSKHIKEIAKAKNLKITWGGDWKKFKDGCHFQIEE